MENETVDTSALGAWLRTQGGRDAEDALYYIGSRQPDDIIGVYLLNNASAEVPARLIARYMKHIKSKK